MSNTSIFSLRDKVYTYITDAMTKGDLKPGEVLDQKQICEFLNISRAPLRDALIRLETEGFVTIVPRIGVHVNSVSIDFIKSAYQIIGALEAEIIGEVFHKLTPNHVESFEISNEIQRKNLKESDFVQYYQENITFHNIFIGLSESILIQDILAPLRRRLYDYPRRHYNYEWESLHLRQHERFIESIVAGNKTAAISIFRDEHWSFELHEHFLAPYYEFTTKK